MATYRKEKKEQRFQESGLPLQVKRPVKSKKKLMNVQPRTSNVQRRIMDAVIFKIDRAQPARKEISAYASESDSTLRHSKFVIRYSAVRFLL
jgi:hypothetical protein